jgi:hypothetical protein
LIAGFLLGAGIDIVFQLIANGGNFKCLDVTSILISGALGAVGGIASKKALEWGARAAFGMKNGRRANTAFPRGMEYLERSRFWPGRWGGPHAGWNQNLVPGTLHALTDRARYRLLRAWWKELNDMYGAVTSFFIRVPWWTPGAAGGGASGRFLNAQPNGACDCQ